MHTAGRDARTVRVVADGVAVGRLVDADELGLPGRRVDLEQPAARVPQETVRYHGSRRRQGCLLRYLHSLFIASF